MGVGRGGGSEEGAFLKSSQGNHSQCITFAGALIVSDDLEMGMRELVTMGQAAGVCFSSPLLPPIAEVQRDKAPVA